MSKGRIGTILFILGAVMVSAAFLLTMYNVADGQRAANEAEKAAAELRERLASPNSLDEFTSDKTPLYKKYPNMDMPLMEIDGEYYCGVLNIPDLQLELPIKSEFSYEGLKGSPCRYSGSVYTNNMIIAGHNYRRHFGDIDGLEIGSKVSFTDGDGNVFNYEIAKIDKIGGYAVDEIDGGDMALFTCDVSGRSRFVVRLHCLNN